MTQKNYKEILNKPGLCLGGLLLRRQLSKVKVGDKVRGGGSYV